MSEKNIFKSMAFEPTPEEVVAAKRRRKEAKRRNWVPSDSRRSSTKRKSPSSSSEEEEADPLSKPTLFDSDLDDELVDSDDELPDIASFSQKVKKEETKKSRTIDDEDSDDELPDVSMLSRPTKKVKTEMKSEEEVCLFLFRFSD